MILFKIINTIALLGLIGLMYNMVRAKEPSDLKNHIYSTIPIGFSILVYILYGIYYIWTN